jgi:(S)-mandelate dehydrogenase
MADSSDVKIRAAVMSRQMDASLNWDELDCLRTLWLRRLLMKGILRPDDTEPYIADCVDGVISSNHGEGQLDAAVSPLEILAATRARTSAPNLIESCYRRGTDIVKASALGANAVLLGRASLYGLVAAGEAGVYDVLRLVKDEVNRTLALIGGPSLSRLLPNYVMADGATTLLPTLNQREAKSPPIDREPLACDGAITNRQV